MSGATDRNREPLLGVKNLTVDLPTPRGLVRAVDGVSLSLEKGKTLAIVGESGCGKSMLCRAIMGVAPASAMIPKRAEINFEQRNLNGLTERQLNRIRGLRMAMIFQDPMSSLNPVLTIGRQIMETLRYHLSLKKKAARDRAVELLEAVGIPHPALRVKQFPHQLSGGMRQRVVMAMALSCEPRLLIADEPTTALDVTVQTEILNLLARLRKESGLAILLTTHDLGLAASFSDDIAVMYAGQIVEQAPSFYLFNHARMPYTKMLIDAIPRMKDPPHTRLPVIQGRPPELIDAPNGCRFAPRCPKALNGCFQARPSLRSHPGSNHLCACFHPKKAMESGFVSGAAQ